MKNGRLHDGRHLRPSQLFVIPLLSCLVMIPPVSSPPTCVLACQERAWVADSGAVETINVASALWVAASGKAAARCPRVVAGGVTPL